MKLLKLRIKNIGILKDIDLDVDKSLLLFYGDIMQGKTTILDSVRFLAGGKAVNIPDNLIREGENEAFIEMLIENGRIKREFYRGTDGAVKARKLEASIGNIPLNQTEVTELFNPFLLDQDCFSKLNPIDKAKFLIKAFGIDTSDLDSEISESESSAKELRAKIRGYGEINLDEVKEPDTKTLEDEKSRLEKEFNDQYELNKKFNIDLKAAYDKEKADYDRNKGLHDDGREKDFTAKNIAGEYLQGLKNVGYEGLEVEEFISKMPIRPEYKIIPPIEPAPIEEMPSREDLDSVLIKISECKAQQVRFEEYQERIERNKRKQSDKDSLKKLELNIKSKRAEKLKMLSVISGKIEGLVFDDSGSFRYNGTTQDRLSDSQKMDLSSKLSALYPDGLKIELIDRGESLGKSVMNLVDRAEKEDRTILVTIVGDEPAEAPEDIGVFTVEQGEFKQ